MFFSKYAGERPVGKAKLEKIQERLRALQGATPLPAETEIGGDATVGNDGGVPADKKAQIERDEALVSAVLQLVGVSYADLITQDVGPNGEHSPYAMAVRANPQLLKDVLAADNPVLAALQVALQYKPYAEFTAKYGADPAAIKAAIAKEVGGKPAEDAAVRKAYGPVFSGGYGGGGTRPVEARKGDLKSVFGR